VPHRVDAAVELVKPAGAQTKGDRSPPHPESLQLSPRNDPMLALRQSRNPGIDSTSLLQSTHTVLKSRLVEIRPPRRG